MRIRSVLVAALALAGALVAGGLQAPPADAASRPADLESQRFSANGLTSDYHLYGSHLAEADGPLGLVVYLHGDGEGRAEHRRPQEGILKAYADVAREHGMLMIAPQEPDPGSDTWWGGEGRSAEWLRALVQDVSARYGVDARQLWFVGYSGGAEAITYHVLPGHGDLVAGGGALLVGGGGAVEGMVHARPLSDSAKADFVMRWIVGAGDSGADDGFDALDASARGRAHYLAQGVAEATREVVRGVRGGAELSTHAGSAWAGPPALDAMLAAAPRA